MSITSWPVSGTLFWSAVRAAWGKEPKLHADGSRRLAGVMEHGKQWLTKLAFEFSLLAPK
jgi:hypothetical protein